MLPPIIPTLLTVLMLNVSPMDGLAPLETTATVTINRQILDVGRVCLIWVNETAPDGLPKSYIDCWDVWPTDRRGSYTRPMAFLGQGVWAVWAQFIGQDKRAKAVTYMTPIADVVTK